MPAVLKNGSSSSVFTYSKLVRERSEPCVNNKLTIETTEQDRLRSVVFTANFEQISHTVLTVDFGHVNDGWVILQLLFWLLLKLKDFYC